MKSIMEKRLIHIDNTSSEYATDFVAEHGRVVQIADYKQGHGYRLVCVTEDNPEEINFNTKFSVWMPEDEFTFTDLNPKFRDQLSFGDEKLLSSEINKPFQMTVSEFINIRKYHREQLAGKNNDFIQSIEDVAVALQSISTLGRVGPAVDQMLEVLYESARRNGDIGALRKTNEILEKLQKEVGDLGYSK